ncbi:hypothetical protein [Ferrimonas sp. SCSIO 43195]|uniref:hypothetical protein n=1 Tax=Ferrimonas sp. SCSIO 43195 TaxID=2822844 RepID=UPI002074FAE8|nr:hypothetical protein [Ferrimonas sp. SCSIO 43195]USD39161.1 hypothetical protein J8Z22_08705 [Ferrimonas sp. SCSIO 43195]
MRYWILVLVTVLAGCVCAPPEQQFLQPTQVLSAVEADEFELCFKVPVGKHLAGPVMTKVSYVDAKGHHREAFLPMEYASKDYLPALKGILMFRKPEYEYHYRLTEQGQQTWKAIQELVSQAGTEAQLVPYPENGMWHHQSLAPVSASADGNDKLRL